MINKSHVFISYSHKDTETMQKVKQELGNAGLKIWTDENIPVGTPLWQNLVGNAIETASSVLVLLSPNARNSEWVQREISYAQAQKKPIIAILIAGTEKTSIPFGLSGSQYIDMTIEFEIGMTLLISKLKDYENDSSRIKILIVDDHQILRRGLIVLLEEYDDLLVIDEAGDGITAVNKCQKLYPDVVLMDVVMPRMDGIKATEIISKSCPETKVVVLTSSVDENHISDATKAGAIGYLEKNIGGDELAEAIRQAYQGKFITH